MADAANGRGPKQTGRPARRTATATATNEPSSKADAEANGRSDVTAASAAMTQMPAGAAADPAASDTSDAAAVSPADAVARHLEWLEFSLGAARAELSWREDRLAKATKRNRDKRTHRLGEIRAEVGELTALLAGLRELAARPAPKARTPKRATTPAPKKRRAVAAPRARRAKSTPAGG